MKRAKKLLFRFEGMSNVSIAEKLDIHRNSVELYLKKYNISGLKSALIDDSGIGRNAMLKGDNKTYVRNLACKKPKEMSYTQELWTFEAFRVTSKNPVLRRDILSFNPSWHRPSIQCSTVQASNRIRFGPILKEENLSLIERWQIF